MADEESLAAIISRVVADVPPDELAKLPSDLSSGPWQMIKNRDARIAELEAELSDTRDGRVVVMPKSREHAGAMHLVAERYLRDNPVSK